MAIDLTGKVGPQTISDGVSGPIRLDRTGSVVTSDGFARYQEPTLRGDMFSGSVVGQTTSAGTNTTYTGLCLSNPPGSQVNLVVNKVGASFIVAFGAGSHIGLMTGFHASTEVTHTAAVTPRCQFFNGSGGCMGKLDSSATLPATPTVNMIFGSGLTGAITTVPQIGPAVVDLEGSLILPPGAFACIYTSTASGSNAGALSFSWQEIPRTQS